MPRQLILAATLLTFAALTACDKESKPSAQKPGSASGSAKTDPAPGTPHETTAAKPAPPGHMKAPASHAGTQAAGGGQGKVIETMNAGGYTYVQLDMGPQKIWAAGPETSVKVGDTVSFQGGSPMQNFPSKTLNRTFETILFVPSLQVAGAPAGGAPAPATSAAHPAPAKAAAVDVAGLTKPKGGYTVAELFEKKAKLSGKAVAVRGKVTKFNRGIMRKNWIHIQDGTGGAGTNDLVVTTALDVVVAVGNTILVSGTAVTDKDFGAGYKYALLLEDAKVTVE